MNLVELTSVFVALIVVAHTALELVRPTSVRAPVLFRAP